MLLDLIQLISSAAEASPSQRVLSEELVRMELACW